MAVVKNLMVRAGADFSGLAKETKKAQQTLGNFKSNVSSVMGKIKAALIAVGIGKLIKDSVGVAIQTEASIQQINRTMNVHSKEFLAWANTQALAYGIAKSEAVKYGAVYSNLISGFEGDTSKVTKYTEDLLKSSAIVASGTGRSMEDVMERIRSGMLGNTESIEDLGINVNVAMIESTDAFKRFAGNKSWQQLDFQTQQQIRLFAILEQSTKKYGDSLNQNTATQQQQFMAQLKNIQLYLGQAFLPIYQIVLPALTKLATQIANIMSVVAQFSQALFGKNQQIQTKATDQQAASVSNLGNAYKKAGKQASNAVASFDQLNTLNDNKSGSDDTPGAAAATAGINTGALNMDIGPNTSETSQKVQAMADSVKATLEQIKGWFVSAWQYMASTFGPPIQQAINSIVPVLFKWRDTFRGVIDDIVSLWGPLKNYVLDTLIPVWQQAIPIWGKIFAGILDTGNMVFKGLWDAAFPVIQWFVTDGLALITNFSLGMLQVFQSMFDAVKYIFDTLWTGAVQPGLMLLSTMTVDTLNIIKGFWGTFGTDIVNGLTTAFNNIKSLFKSLWDNFLGPFVKNFLEQLSWLWNNHFKGVVEELTNFIGKLITGALEIYNKFISPLVKALIEIFGPTFSNVFTLVTGVITTFLGVIGDVVKGVLKALGGIIDFVVGVFTGDWKKAWLGIKEFTEGIWDALVGVLKGAVNIIIDAVNFLIRGLNTIKVDIPSWVPGIGGKNLGISIPQIPKLAEGGITNGPMLAMIGDNPGGHEVVSPLDDLREMLIDAVTSAMSEMKSQMQTSGDVILKIGETEFGKVAINAINRAQRQAGTTLLIV